MGRETVLVIGDNFRDQLLKFQRADCADLSNRHFGPLDILGEARREYAAGTIKVLKHSDGSLFDPWCGKCLTPNSNGLQQRRAPGDLISIELPNSEAISFVEWARKNYDCASNILPLGAQPDLAGADRRGWMRLDADGQVCELIDRTIPGGFHDWFERTENSLPLKPGARGLAIDYDEITIVTDGCAGLARKSAIDFDVMRKAIKASAGARWDRANAASRSQRWLSFEEIYGRKEGGAYSHEWHVAATKEWLSQPAVQAIIADDRLLPSKFVEVALQPQKGDAIAGTAVDRTAWDQLTPTERRAEYLVGGNQTPRGIDPLALPRDEFLQRYGLGTMLRASEVIMNGALLKNCDEEALIDSLPGEIVLTLATVHS